MRNDTIKSALELNEKINSAWIIWPYIGIHLKGTCFQCSSISCYIRSTDITSVPLKRAVLARFLPAWSNTWKLLLALFLELPLFCFPNFRVYSWTYHTVRYLLSWLWRLTCRVQTINSIQDKVTSFFIFFSFLVFFFFFPKTYFWNNFWLWSNDVHNIKSVKNVKEKL